jgi:hypothetical protein
MKKNIFAVLLPFFLAACASTNSANTSEPISSADVEVEETLQATKVTLIADLVPSTTYSDPNLGYAFDYPADWTISALPDVTYSAVTIHSWDPDNLTGPRPQGEGLPEGGEKMDILPQADYGKDFEKALPWFREGNADHKFTEEPVTLPTGISGILIRFEPVSGEPMVRCLLTAVRETTMLLCGAGWDLQYFEPIAFSLREAQ